MRGKRQTRHRAHACMAIPLVVSRSLVGCCCFQFTQFFPFAANLLSLYRSYALAHICDGVRMDFFVYAFFSYYYLCCCCCCFVMFLSVWFFAVSQLLLLLFSFLKHWTFQALCIRGAQLNIEHSHTFFSLFARFVVESRDIPITFHYILPLWELRTFDCLACMCHMFFSFFEQNKWT